MKVLASGIDTLDLSFFMEPITFVPVDIYDDIIECLTSSWGLKRKSGTRKFYNKMMYMNHYSEKGFTLQLKGAFFRKHKFTSSDECIRFIFSMIDGATKGLLKLVSITSKINRADYFIDWKGKSFELFSNTYGGYRYRADIYVDDIWQPEAGHTTSVLKNKDWEVRRYNKTMDIVTKDMVDEYIDAYTSLANPVIRTEISIKKDLISRYDAERRKAEPIARKVLENIQDELGDIELLLNNIESEEEVSSISCFRMKSFHEIEAKIYEDIGSNIIKLHSLHKAVGGSLNKMELAKNIISITSSTTSDKEKTKYFKRLLKKPV